MEGAAVFKEMAPAARTVIVQAVRRLWGFPEVARVFLYGSYAKGTQTPESDVDIAAFAPDNVYGKPLFKQLLKACTVSEIDVQVQLFPLSDLESPCGIIAEIQQYGIELPREITKEDPEAAGR
jgi:predicted nucleotidyltransferase